MKYVITIEIECDEIDNDVASASARIRNALDHYGIEDARIIDARQQYLPIINDDMTKRMVAALEKMVPKKDEWNDDQADGG